MSFILTKMVCEKCKYEFDMAFQIPDRHVSVYPNKSEYVIGTCEKNNNYFTLSCVCKKCKQNVVRTYSKQEFSSLIYKILE